jgi:hypothetical protein
MERRSHFELALDCKRCLNAAIKVVDEVIIVLSEKPFAKQFEYLDAVQNPLQ